MHGLVCPHNLKLNKGFGILAIFLYGLFSYPKLLHKHWLHHHYPATIKDPDFHDGNNAHCLAWYFHFLKGYWHWGQFSSCVIFISLIGYVFKLEPINLILFWAVPLILSSGQLFYFGTFLPHRQPPEGYDNFHRANSSNFSVICSFFSCYHFGYHREHHEHPDLPWWQLSQIHFKKGDY
jgi:beta-carotene ketolase (CrtW type)